jgi:hypothetical protein
MRALVFIVATCGGLLLSVFGLVLSMAVEGAHGIPTFMYVLAGMLAVAHVIAIALAVRYLRVDKFGKAAAALIAPLPAVWCVVFIGFIVTTPFRM